ncbi:MAG: PEP-CTERM sorting domain-containing protein [Gammaproteobacteria bacterium]
MRLNALLAFAATFIVQATCHATVIYDNLVTPIGNYLGGFTYVEAADDVTLGPGPRVFQRLTVAYAGFNFDGDETLTATLYAMDGAPTPGSFGFNTPGTVLFSSTVPILASDGTTVAFVDPAPSILLPDYLAIGLAFGGVDFDPTGGGSDAGPLLFHPPAVGSSFDDYWLRGFPTAADDWALFTFGGTPPINFGARIETVDGRIPEPGSLALVLLGLGGAAWRRVRTLTGPR